MFQSKIESMLEKSIGLSSEAIGAETIRRAISRRMMVCGLTRMGQYLELLDDSREESELLIEEVVVPETWFFRNKASFAYLGRYIRSEWQPGANKKIRRLRVLSLPCASGEEPWSIAITLLDTGLSNEVFHIDAVDISHRALQKAGSGIYRKESFRGDELSFRDRYFKSVGDGFQIASSVMKTVRFFRGNILDPSLLSGGRPYDIVFCRNLLIYLSERARKRGLGTINRLLADDGILFVGHVERPQDCESGFEWIRHPGVFACRKTKTRQKTGMPSPSSKSSLTVKKMKTVSGNKPTTVVNWPDIIKKPVAPNPAMQEKESDPSDHPDVEALLENAQRLADQGDLDNALKLCEKSIQRDSLHVRAHFLMGLICQALDDEERAEASFNKSVYLDPNHHEALSHLAFIMEHRGEREIAGQIRQRARRIRERQ